MSNRETPAQLERGKPIHRKALFLRAMDVLLRETGATLSRENVFPKRTRWLYAYAIMDLVNNAHSWAMYANGIEVDTRELMLERYRAQTVALAWLYALNVKMSAAQIALSVPPEKCETWARLYDEARDRVLAWRSGNLRRYSAKFGGLSADELGELPDTCDPVSACASPNPSNATNVRNSTTSGTLNNNNARNTNGAVSDREKA